MLVLARRVVAVSSITSVDVRADADFHGRRPAVYMNRHPLWDLMSEHSDTLSQLSVHPASPVLLTRSGPLETSILLQGTMKLPRVHAHLEFENRSRVRYPQCLQSFALPGVTTFMVPAILRETSE